MFFLIEAAMPSAPTIVLTPITIIVTTPPVHVAPSPVHGSSSSVHRTSSPVHGSSSSVHRSPSAIVGATSSAAPIGPATQRLRLEAVVHLKQAGRVVREKAGRMVVGNVGRRRWAERLGLLLPVFLRDFDDEGFGRAGQELAVEAFDGRIGLLLLVEPDEGGSAKLPRPLVAQQLQVDDLSVAVENLSKGRLVEVGTWDVRDVLQKKNEKDDQSYETNET